MEEFGSVLVVIIGLLSYLLPVLLRARKTGQTTYTPPPTPVLDFRTMAQAVDNGLRFSDAVAEKTQALKKRANAAIGPARILSEVLDVLAREQRALRGALEASAAQVQSGQLPYQLQQVLAELEWQGVRLGAVEIMLENRSDRTSGEMMADADAIAAACLEPIVSFSQRRDLGFPHQRPLCVPAMPGREAIFFGLLPPGYPTVFVPQDFGEDLLRWPALSHEVGHVVWREMPRFADEMREVCRLRVDPIIPAGPAKFSLNKAYAAWLEEIFCDFFAVLQLGPPALRGMIHAFGPPRIPRDQLVWSSVAYDGGHYEEHPPPHLRIVLAAHTLWEMGFDVEAKQLMRQWNALSGEVNTYGFHAIMAGPFGIPADKVEAFGRELVGKMYETQMRSLNGFAISSIPGLPMSPGLWAHVRREVGSLLEGDAHHDDPRVVIAAAVEARAQSKGSSRRLARTVSRAIVGIGEPRHRPREQAPSIPSGEARDEIMEAMILYQVLERRRRGLRRRPSRVARL